MITKLSLQDDDMLDQIWRLQHIAYRLEAEIIGFYDIPPLLDTHETLKNCGEDFYGCLDDEGELLGAVATKSEAPGSLTLMRMMVHPDHFRQGIAGKLIQHVLDDHPELPLFIVSTGVKNEPAVALYHKYGFVPFDTFEVAPGVELATFHRRSGQTA
ncbi:GNAT family N-acetyltransferase [Paenibacillus chibensis]|uniref:GNAT family N-acetyltransferase n=1 Tax=Paenibacillus chibensis TaxID=59846 RepID=A0ABU6PQS7_9BACL|nr:GNAT family N-acetyltransferase [Paenibacillus chibensis]MEC0370824.1 GNAT family N-acetyltransferase [Paenibacillus chibensis]MED5017237.1 GNAT family N-acetyltransferase [Paenibacillus chibensis]